jgi:hypothetical protein
LKKEGDFSLMLEARVPSLDEPERNWFSLIRIAIFLGVSFAGIALIYGSLIFLLPDKAMSRFDAAFQGMTFFWLLCCALYFWGVVEKKTLPEMGFALKRTDLMAGISIGMCAILLLYGLGFVFNLISLAPLKSGLLPAFGGAFGLAIALTILEEILFRGYLFQTLLSDMPHWLAAAIASFLFAQVHFLRQGNLQELLLPFLGFFLAGLSLCYATWLTGNLSLAMGLHFSWLFALSLFERLGIWSYPQPFLTGKGNPLTGFLGIVAVVVISAALRYVYGSPSISSGGARSGR